MELAKRELSLPDGKLYADENEFFSKGKLVDILFVCTQDELHYGHAIRAMKLGYDLLLEKPIAASVKQCR